MEKKAKIQRSIILTKEMLEKLEQIANRRCMSVSDVMREAITKYVKSYDSKKED